MAYKLRLLHKTGAFHKEIFNREYYCKLNFSIWAVGCNKTNKNLGGGGSMEKIKLWVMRGKKCASRHPHIIKSFLQSVDSGEVK